MVSRAVPSIPSRKATLPEIMRSLLIISSFQPLSAFKKYLSSSAWGSASLLLLACCLIHKSLKKVNLIFECFVQFLLFNGFGSNGGTEGDLQVPYESFKFTVFLRNSEGKFPLDFGHLSLCIAPLQYSRLENPMDGGVW